MNAGRHVLSQIVNFVHWEKLQRLARRYEPNQKIKHFGFRQQFICMVFVQLTWREGLCDIETKQRGHHQRGSATVFEIIISKGVSKGV